MPLIQEIIDQYGPKLKEDIKKLDNELPKKVREEAREFLKTLPQKYGTKK